MISRIPIENNSLNTKDHEVMKKVAQRKKKINNFAA
jgi:hypothetical protein